MQVINYNNMANGDTKLRFAEKQRYMVMLNKLGGSYVIYNSLSPLSLTCKKWRGAA